MSDTPALADLAATLAAFDVPAYDVLPEIDLYMDQVIGYLNRLLCRVCRSEDGAPLTPSMINNYVKGGHVERPVQKKYSHDRLAMLYMLCCLKQNLTISEAAALLGGEDTAALFARFRALQTETLRGLSAAVPPADADADCLRETALRLSLHSAAERLLAEAIIAALPAEAEDAQPTKKQKKAK